MSLWIFVTMVLFLGLASAVGAIDAATDDNGSIVYGVRWFLGEKFRFQKPIGTKQKYGSQQQSHLVLLFNSQKQWANHTFIAIIEGHKYECSVTEVKVNVSSNHHQKFNQFASSIGDQFVNYIYKCPVYFEDSSFLKNKSQFGYEIAVQGSQINRTLVKAQLRSPLYNLSRFSMTTFGDWGKMTSFSPQFNKSAPIDDCLLQRIKQDDNIRLMLLLGDLAYDMEGKSYIEFMKYLQQYSRQIVLLFSPGNHETIKHKDIFLLAKESFYSPSWRYFYGYFDLVQLGEYVFVGVNTQAYFWDGLAVESNSSLFTIELQEEYDSFYHLFRMQLSDQTISKLKKGFKVIGYSHYPIYCSEEDNHEKCSLYHDRHSEVLRVYRQLGMQLYLSGHLHIYERSKQVCSNGTMFREGSIIDNATLFRKEGDCSVFVIEGAAGNNYYIETERHFPLKNHSGAFVNNTGFGVLQLSSNQIIFQHIAVGEGCLIADRFIIADQKAELIIEIEGDMQEIRLLYIMQGVLVLISLLIAISVCWRRRATKKRQAHRLAERSMQNVSQFVQLSIA